MLNKHFLTLLFVLLQSATALAGSFTVNQIGGFSDVTAASPVGGNPGTTIGAQRANLFNYAAAVWTSIVQPSVNMAIDAEFATLTCTVNSATLGSAGPTNAYMNFSGAAFASTWYPVALRNHLTTPLNGDAVIDATFNSQLNGNPNCLGGMSWYYGYDHNPGVNQIDLLEIILHEMGHGLGFITYVNLVTGAKAGTAPGYDDIYMRFLRDNSLNKSWPAMTNAERVTSAKDSGDLVWTGSQVQHLTPTLGSGTTNNYPRLYAPTVVSAGSSVSHWDTNVSYITYKHELMEHLYNTPFDMALTVALMRDLGWSGALYDFDGDNTDDTADAYPHLNSADADTDGDGMVDRWLPGSGCSGSSCSGLTLDGDDDGDGVPDVVDAAPLNAGNQAELSLPMAGAYKGLKYTSNQQRQ